MAYFSQEQKMKIAPQLKSICKKYKIKASVAVRNHSTVVLNIKSGEIDFIKNFNEIKAKRNANELVKDNLQVNEYWYKEQFSGKALEFLTEVLSVMNIGNYNNSDIQSDYFDVGHYTDVNIGQWDTPYILTI